jgi:hypothetical protein
MLRRLLTSLFALLVALSLPASALAQDYLFRVDKEVVQVFWNSDGTLGIDYTWDFNNQPGAHAIDFVDVGTPSFNFDMGSINADVNGTPVAVSQGDYQGSGSGFAIVLGSLAIPAGGEGRVHVIIGRVSGMLLTDDLDQNYASADFSPTWFGSQYVAGSTDLSVTFHLPPGVKPEEPRYHPPQGWPGAAEPQAGFDDQGRITYTWSSPDANAHSQYLFGASFPKSYVPAGAIQSAPTYNIPTTPLISPDALFNLFCVGLFVLMFFGGPLLALRASQRRKLQYLPPKIAIEGHGIKRGLTAVEAAILLEQPLDKVMTMILFGVIKKNAAQVRMREPLALAVAAPLPDDLYDYETGFLKSFKASDSRERRRLLQEMAIRLVRSVAEKMRGFSRRETQDYYKNIMEQAWAQIAAAGTPEIKSQLFDQNLEWTMLDRDYDDRTRRVFTGPVYTPAWWGRYDPVYRTTTSVGPRAAAAPSSPQGKGLSVPSLPGSDFAASVVGGVQTFSQKVIGDVRGFTSRVSNVTNPPPPPSTRSYRGGGSGGGCACACACAGCACACAGGGR